MIHSARSMGALEWALLALLSLLWGGSFFFGKLALAELQPFTVVLGRVGIAAVILNAMVRASGHRMPVTAQAWGAFPIMGMLNNFIPFSLIFWGKTRISSSLASILNATAPAWAILLAHVLTADERLTASRVAGVVSCLAVLCTALAYIIYFRLLSTAGATNLLLVTFLIPVSAIFLGVVFLDEALSAGQTAGMG